MNDGNITVHEMKSEKLLCKFLFHKLILINMQKVGIIFMHNKGKSKNMFYYTESVTQKANSGLAYSLSHFRK